MMDHLQILCMQHLVHMVTADMDFLVLPVEVSQL